MCFYGRNRRIINELDAVIGDEVPESDGFPNPKLIAPQRLGPRGHPGGDMIDVSRKPNPTRRSA